MAKREQFYEFVDAYKAETTQIVSLQRQLNRKIDVPEVAAYYERVAKKDFLEAKEADNSLGLLDPHRLFLARKYNQCLGQGYWNKIGKPYCKVFPGMTRMLAKTNINIDCKHFQLPFGAFAIRFSESHPFVAAEGDPPIQAVLMLGEFSGRNTPHGLTSIYEGCQSLLLLLDFGEKFEDQELKSKGVTATNKYYQYLKMNLVEGKTLEEQLDAAVKSTKRTEIDDLGYTPPLDFQRKVLATCVASCFFVRNEHEIIAPDIPARLKDRWNKAEQLPEKRKKKEHQHMDKERKRLGHYGWALGREIELPRRHFERSEDSNESHKRGELKFQHYRGAHPRWQKVGPRNKPDVKLIFIAPTMVRPDLPLPPAGPRYKITDRALKEQK